MSDPGLLDTLIDVAAYILIPLISWILYICHKLDKDSAVKDEQMAQVKDRLNGQHDKFSVKLDKIDVELQEMKVSMERIETDIHHLSNGKPPKDKS